MPKATDTTQVDAPYTCLPREAVKLTGKSIEDVRAAMKRAIDPLPSTICGKGTGKRVYRKVIVSEIGPWLKREAERDANRV